MTPLSFTSAWFNSRTKQYYDLTRKNHNSFENVFARCFETDYELMFNNASYKDSLYTLLEKFYKNEEIIKDKFRTEKLKSNSEINFCELPIINSRIDIVSIDKCSCAYEIKTKYDNLNRLTKQLSDYLMCFEYVYIITCKEKLEKAKKIVPSCVGIYTYNDNARKIKFDLVRKANYSPYLSYPMILKKFSKKDLDYFFKTNNMHEILLNFSKEDILLNFKKMIVRKYSNKN